MHPSYIANVTTPQQLQSILPPSFGRTIASARTAVPPAWHRWAAGVDRDDLLRPPKAVTWLPGGAAFTFLQPFVFNHPFHFGASSLGLWALRRMNLSAADSTAFGRAYGESDVSSDVGEAVDAPGAYPSRVASLHLYNYTLGGLSPEPPSSDFGSGSDSSTRGGSGNGGRLPPLDFLIYHTSIEGASWSLQRLKSWSAVMLRLIAPPSMRVLWPRDLQQTHKVSADHWLCAPRGVVFGQKIRLFNGPRDASAFRLAAYAAAGINRPAWPALPPRTITLIVREDDRRFLNFPAVLSLLRSRKGGGGGGLPVRVATGLASMPWEEQVALFAGSGIVVAAHGAALTNLIFMPVRSVVIEIFPFLFAPLIFRRIADAARIGHYPLYSRYPSNASLAHAEPKTRDLWTSPHFIADCRDARISDGEANLSSDCDVPGRDGDFEVPLDRLAVALEAALNDIGCRDGYCRLPGTSEVRRYDPADYPAEEAGWATATGGG